MPKKVNKPVLHGKMPDLKPKKVKGRITTLKVMPYKKVMVYIRQIDGEIFEFMIPFKGEIYSSYLIIKPRKGKKKLSKDEVNQAGALIFASAVTTVDYLLDRTKKMSKVNKKLVN